MKKTALILTMIMIVLCIYVPAVFADSISYDVERVNYYVYVATPDGGLNMRVGPGVDYSKVMNDRIPDGVKLHITLKSNNWGYTSYNGHEGWVALKQTTTISPKPYKETANYYVYVSTPDGGLNMRVGPGVDYNKVMKERIPDGIQLHITQKSGTWGYTCYNGNYGWVSLTQTTTTPPAQNNSENTNDTYVQPNDTNKNTKDADLKANNTDNTANPQTTANSKVPAQNNSNAKGSLINQIVLIAIILALVVVIAILMIIIINSRTRS